MNIDRRTFLSYGLYLPILGKLPIPRLVEYEARLLGKATMKFYDGDKLEIFLIKGETPGQFFCLNSMNHAEGIMTTSFALCELDIYDPDSITIEYKGYDKLGKLVYENVGNHKVWKDYSDQNIYMKYFRSKDGLPYVK